MKQLVECVPNISEGRDQEKIKIISQIVEEIDGVKLLNVDPGKATNRTVITFVGEPQQVIDAAFLLIQKAQELIDMSKHTGEHPRMGATDVCPLVPIANISMEETAKWAHKLGERVGTELGIPIYHYEAAAKEEKRKNLASCRSGEYEGLSKKLIDPKSTRVYFLLGFLGQQLKKLTEDEKQQAGLLLLKAKRGLPKFQKLQDLFLQPLQ